MPASPEWAPAAVSARRIRLGVELRRLRESLDLSGDEVADTLGWSQSKVSRIEAAKHSVSVQDVAALLGQYGVSQDVRAELLGMAAEEIGESAWVVRAGGSPRRQGHVASVEVTAARVRQYHPLIVPGLLQTADYARGVITGVGFPNAEPIVAARLQRQKILTAEHGPQFEVVLDERALWLRPGPVAVVAAQLHRLAELARSVPRLSLRIVPVDVEDQVVGMVPFIEYTFTDSPPVVFIETPTADLFLAAASDVSTYSALFDRLTASALEPEDSARYLLALAGRLTSDHTGHGGAS